MLIKDVHPTTIGGVKRLASQIRKKQSIKHSEALNLAAKAASCTNFRNAQSILPVQGMAQFHPYVLLTIYWLDKEQGHQRGRETLRIELSEPILDLCTKSALKYVRGFSNLRMVSGDHFVGDFLASSQDQARDGLCAAERSLRFMEHTGLRPGWNHKKAYPKGLENDKLPNIDHSTDWVAPDSGDYVLVDEPYGNVPDEEERAAWSARNGWRIIKTSWPGMYSPHACELYIAVDGQSGYDLDALIKTINTMPAPLTPENWNGETSQSWDTFLSPMAKTKQDKRRARCRGTIYPMASATTVPYSYDVGDSRRRPVGELGIDGHIEAGRIIKAILLSRHIPYWAWNRLNSLRYTLDAWLGLEIGRGQLEGPEFFDVYARETDEDKHYQKNIKARSDIIAALHVLKLKLCEVYPDCAPLRQQLRRIDMSVSLIEKTPRPDN